MTRSLILCIDPGLAKVGWAVLQVLPGEGVALRAVGAVQTKPGDAARVTEDHARRVHEILDELSGAPLDANALIAICSEAFTLGSPKMSPPSTAAKQGMGWAVGLVLAHVHVVPFLQATSHEMRAAVCPGVKKATKEDMAVALLDRFGDGLAHLMNGVNPPDLREHAYDALAVGLACLGREEVRIARGRLRAA